MILVTWFCQRCGKKVKARRYKNVTPYDFIDPHEEMCSECAKAYEDMMARQKDELQAFWKERK